MLLLFTDRTAVSKQCLLALEQWYETMIPALFPMMLLSSILVDTGFAVKVGNFCNKTLFRFFNISNWGCYCLLSGFLFGFPMGAKTTSDLRLKKLISAKEAEYLMSFINCIGPMYTINLIHHLFPQHLLWKLMLLLYGLPLCYGLFLRYTLFRSYSFEKNIQNHISIPNETFADALYMCVPKCGKSILMLGGYMILFQISFISLQHLLESINIITNIFYPLLEITGGLFKLSKDTSLPAIIFYTTFGGGCCLLQTYSFLKPAQISIKKYILHKWILACFSSILSNLFL